MPKEKEKKMANCFVAMALTKQWENFFFHFFFSFYFGTIIFLEIIHPQYFHNFFTINSKWQIVTGYYC